MHRPHWRKLTWAILVFNLIMLVWLITGVAHASHNPHCLHTAVLGARTCQGATDTGTAIGAALLILMWAAGDAILGTIWLVTRGRECPACGMRVRRGLTACAHCSHAFG